MPISIETKANIPIIVLAAGSSSRLGSPKQLLSFKGKTLIEYIVSECHKSALGEVIVVTGAQSPKVTQQLHTAGVTFVHNPFWPTGMGSSIACGVQYVSEQLVQGVMIVLVDQPYFTKDILIQIARKSQETKAPIVVSRYASGVGPPAFFDKSLLPELMKLIGEKGAKPLIKQHKSEVEYVDFEKGGLDIDLPEHLERLKKAAED